MTNKERQSAAKLEKMNEKYVNNTFGNLYVLEYAYNINYKKVYKCLCKRCNSFTFVRSDRFSKNPKSCGNCVNSLQKEIANAKYLENRKFRKIYNSYRGNANTRSYDFNLNFEQFKTFLNKNCFYCNTPNSNGLDRLNNNEGYHINNVVTCCKICNFMKNNYTLNDFIEQIKKIYLNFQESSTTISKESTN